MYSKSGNQMCDMLHLLLCNRNVIVYFIRFLTPQATVEPVVYATLSSSQPHKKGNKTATVDQHQVTYATVDVDATMKQAAKAATLPASQNLIGESQCHCFESCPCGFDLKVYTHFSVYM